MCTRALRWRFRAHLATASLKGRDIATAPPETPSAEKSATIRDQAAKNLLDLQFIRHQQLGMTKRYAHLSISNLHEAGARIEKPTDTTTDTSVPQQFAYTN
jgi:hypothetical protein